MASKSWMKTETDMFDARLSDPNDRLRKGNRGVPNSFIPERARLTPPN